MDILLATNNRHTAEELSAMLSEIGAKVLTLSDIGYTKEIVEDGDSFEENAMIKARIAASLGYIGVGDDSGLCTDALSGEPGVYSARYAGEPCDDRKNNEKLLEKLKDVPKEKRGAKFVSVIAGVFPDGREIIARGECAGTILYDYRGTGGFGYDPLFLCDRLGKTFAELNPEEKNTVSHRARAMEKFIVLLKAETEKNGVKNMLTSKQRAYLRGKANDMDTIFQIGKSGTGDNMTKQLSDALEARELIKIRTLESSPLSAREAADSLAASLGAEVIGVIGSRIILYRESNNNKKYSLEIKNI